MTTKTLGIERTGAHEFAMIFSGPLAALMTCPDSSKRVYMWLCLQAKAGRCWYSTGRAIADATQLSERSVWRAIRDLVERGLVSRTTRSVDAKGALHEGAEGGWSEANIYRIHDDGPVEVDRSDWCERCGSPFHSVHPARTGNRPDAPVEQLGQVEGLPGCATSGRPGSDTSGTPQKRRIKGGIRSPSEHPPRGAVPPAPPLAPELADLMAELQAPAPATSHELEAFGQLRQMMDEMDEESARDCGWDAGRCGLEAWKATHISDAEPQGTPGRAIDLTDPRTFLEIVAELRCRYPGPTIRRREVHAAARWLRGQEHTFCAAGAQ